MRPGAAEAGAADDGAAPARAAVIGAGGVGGLLAALLCRTGLGTTLYARSGADPGRLPSGIRVHRGDQVTTAPVRWSSDWTELAGADVVVIAVKAWQVAEACEVLRDVHREGAVVVTLQNGLRAPEIARALLPRAAVLPGVCDVRCWRERPGVIRWLGDSISVVVGGASGSTPSSAEMVVRALERAGVLASVAPDVRVPLWTKLAFIAAFGGVGAVTRLPIGDVRAHPSSRRLLADVVSEVAAVARAAGVPLRADLVPALLERIDGLPGAATASLQRDVAGGLPSELDDLITDVVRRAKELGVPAPACAFIAAVLEPIEELARRA